MQEEGRQLVLEQYIGPGVPYEAIKSQIYMNIESIKDQIPGAVYRIGCTCCYGDGPDIEYEVTNMPEGGVTAKFWVNFDFED